MNKFEGHTPGPWRVAPASEYVGTEINVDSNLYGFVCLAGHRGDKEAEANARLIAAAPDLLAQRDRLVTALGLSLTQLMFAAERAVAHDDMVAASQIRDAVVVARAILAEIEGGK